MGEGGGDGDSLSTSGPARILSLRVLFNLLSQVGATDCRPPGEANFPLDFTFQFLIKKGNAMRSLVYVFSKTVDYSEKCLLYNINFKQRRFDMVPIWFLKVL